MPTMRTITAHLHGGPLDGDEVSVEAGYLTIRLVPDDERRTAVYRVPDDQVFAGSSVVYEFDGYV